MPVILICLHLKETPQHADLLLLFILNQGADSV